MGEAIEKYWQLVADLDCEIARITGFYTHLKCCPGCSDCCRSFSVFPLEAEIIRRGRKLTSEDSYARQVGAGDFCELLKDKRCRIYEHRPLICRTQGLPLGYIDHDQGVVEVSACELNFSGHDFDVERLLMMDTFNERLQEINQEFCKAKNIDPWQRIPIRELT